VDRVTISAPASSANLGPGYDCLAVALPLRTELVVERSVGGLTVQVAGEGAEELVCDGGNLVVRAFEAAFGQPAEGLSFALHNHIPLRAGAGSSSAAIVAGCAAGLALRLGRAPAPDDVLPYAVALEGHPDNVAAAILGGFTVAADGQPPVAHRIEPPAGLSFVLVTPGARLSTADARALLPGDVPLPDAVHNIQHSALLVCALRDGRLDLLSNALDDRLHERHRARLVPLLVELRGRAAGLGCYGVTLSGAGPSVLMWTPTERCRAVAEAVAGIAPDSSVMALAPDARGLVCQLE